MKYEQYDQKSILVKTCIDKTSSLRFFSLRNKLFIS